MKKICIVLFLFLLIIFKNNVIASDINVSGSNVQIYVNKNVVELIEEPLNINGCTYISIMDIHNIFGYNFKFDYNKKELKLTYESIECISQEYITNANKIIEYNLYIEEVYSGSAYFYNNLTYVPLRIVSDRNLCDIYWNAESNIIDLNYNISNIEGGEILSVLSYTNSLGYNYIFIAYQNIIDNSKSMLVMEYDGIINGEFNNVKELLEKVDIKKINDRKIINMSNDEYQIFVSKVNNLLNDKNKGNKENFVTSSYQCDFTCYIIFNKDNSNTMFKSYPILETNMQYDELKKYLKDISGYDMEYITPYNI